MIESLRLIVFDWDGTLMDSEARIVGCMQAALRDVGVEPLPPARIRQVIGLGLNEAVHALQTEATTERLQAVADRYRHHFLTDDTIPSQPFAGAEDTLQALTDRGYLLAVATGKGRRGLDRALEETGFGRFFHATRCADETRSKPHPQMLLELMDSLGAEPEETLVVGDTEFDLQMATNAGAAALAVSYGVHERECLLLHDPLACLDDIRDVALWLCAENARD